MIKKILNFIRDVHTELRDKTTWPSRDEVLNSTIIVSTSIAVVSAMLFFVDLGSSSLVRFVVVDNVSFFKIFFSELTFVLFVLVTVLVIIIYTRLKSRLLR